MERLVGQPAQAAGKRADERELVGQALKRMEVSFSLPNRPAFQACGEPLAAALLGCGAPGKAAERLEEAGKQLREEDRLKFYSEGAARIASSISNLEPARAAAALQALADAAKGIRSEKEEDYPGRSYYWLNTAPAAAGFLSRCSEGAFHDVVRAAGRKPDLACEVFFSVYRYASRARVLEDGEFRKFLLELGGRRNGTQVARAVLDECSPRKLGEFMGKRNVFLGISKDAGVAGAYIRMLRAGERAKAAVLERAARKTKATEGYLGEVLEWLNCLEEGQLLYKDGRSRLGKDEPLLGQLERIALGRFSSELRLKPEVIGRMTDYPALLCEFIKIYFGLPADSQAEIRRILRKCARGKKPGELKASEEMFRDFIRRKGLPIDPDAMVKSFSETPESIDQERRWELIGLRDEVALLSALAELTRTHASLRRRVGEAFAFAEPSEEYSGDLSSIAKELHGCIKSNIERAVNAGIIKPGEFRLPDLKELDGLGSEQIARRLRKALKLSATDARRRGALALPEVREAFELKRAGHLSNFISAIREELDLAEKFAEESLKADILDYGMAAVIGWHASELRESLLALSSGSSLEGIEQLTFEVIDRLRKPVDFLMLGNCRPTCARLDILDGGKAEAEMKLLQQLAAIPDENHTPDGMGLTAVERTLLSHLERRGLIVLSKKTNPEGIYLLTSEARELVESKTRPEPFERAMMDYFMDWGTAGIMARTADSAGRRGKPIGHMFGHACYDKGKGVFGCNGFYLEERYRSEENYLRAARFNLESARRAGFDEYRHSLTELQDSESKPFFANFRPFGDAAVRVSVREDLQLEYHEFGSTWKIPSITTKPFKFIADFFMDNKVPGTCDLNALHSTRPYLAVRLKADADAERGEDPIEVALAREMTSYEKAVKGAARRFSGFYQIKYRAFVKGGPGDLDIDADGLLLATFKRCKGSVALFASAVEERLPGEKRHMARRIVDNFLGGQTAQWDPTRTDALLNALSSCDYHILCNGSAEPAATWLERCSLRSPVEGADLLQRRNACIAVKTEAGLVPLRQGTGEEEQLVAALRERLPPDRRDAAYDIAGNLCTGQLVQWSEAETNALLDAFANGNIFTYKNGPVSLKWLIERSYFGRPVDARVGIRLCRPAEYDRLVEEAYQIFSAAGEIDTAKIRRSDFVEFYRKKEIATLPQPNGVLLAVNQARAHELRFHDVLLSMIHGIGHAQLGTAHIPDLPLGKNRVAEIISEGFARHITLCALEKADELYRNGGFDLLHDLYLLKIDSEMDAEVCKENIESLKILDPGMSVDEYADHIGNAREGFIIARALWRNVSKESFRGTVLPVLFEEIAKGAKDLDEYIGDWLLPVERSVVKWHETQP